MDGVGSTSILEETTKGVITAAAAIFIIDFRMQLDIWAGVVA